MRIAVLGVDLASASWAANGSALATFEQDGEWVAVEPGVIAWPREGKPTAALLAERIDSVAREMQAAAVSIDAPQGWRDPSAPAGWGRRADREARTPGKMGPPRTCVPGTYLAWVSLGVELFAELRNHPNVRLANDPVDRLDPLEPPGYHLLESFPTSTWRTAGLTPLPAKAKTKDLAPFASELARTFGLPAVAASSHDDLQAVVAALPAAALLGGPAEARVRGIPGRLVDGEWVEGIIWDAAPAAARAAPRAPTGAPLLVVVTGPPAAGKTTLAKPLAAALGLPLVSRDELKETLFAALGAPNDVESTRRLGSASFDLLHLIAARLLAAGCSAVLEANFFRGASETAFTRLPAHRLVQVHCSAPADVVLARYAGRPRHPGHLDAERADEVAARLADGTHDPLDLPGAVISVETSRDVDVAAVAAQIRSAAE